MMSITTETRKQSYEAIKPTLNLRQSNILSALKFFPEGKTAGELAMFLWDKDIVDMPDRNSVHPRLTELAKLDLVSVGSKRKCTVSGRTCAVYTVKGV